uniref:E3 ubiquitin-protein ligase n=1 Tax=Strongyloides venezuelensis TaxID=75913 RepID=A0A0K0F013_STRVS
MNFNHFNSSCFSKKRQEALEYHDNIHNACRNDKCIHNNSTNSPIRGLLKYRDSFDINSKNNYTDNGKSENNHTDNGKSENNHTDNGKSENNYTENGKSENNHTDNRRSQNNFTDNGKSENNYTENGKSENNHTDNGRSQNNFTDNGRSENNHTDNGRSENNYTSNANRSSNYNFLLNNSNNFGEEPRYYLHVGNPENIEYAVWIGIFILFVMYYPFSTLVFAIICYYILNCRIVRVQSSNANSLLPLEDTSSRNVRE